MTFITLLIFSIVWTGLAWASAIMPWTKERADWSGWWALHLAAAILPIAALGILMMVPPLFPGAAIAIPADLSFLAGGDAGGGGGVAEGAGPWPRVMAALPLLAAGLYAMIAAVLLCRFFHGRLVLRGIVQRACPVFVSASGVPVLVTAKAITPFATGGLRPMIVMPAALIEEVGEAGIWPVIEHEASHIARHDPDLSSLFSLVAIFLWPSPFVRALVQRWRLSAELQCDRAALAGACRQERKRYARTLLAAFRITAGGGAMSTGAAGKAATGRALPCPPAAFSTSQLKDEKMRMLQIMQGQAGSGKTGRRGASLWIAAGCLALTGTLAVALADGQVVAAPAGSAPLVQGGEISSAYGPRHDPMDSAKRQHHRGVDIKADMGAPVFTPADAVVLEATETYRGYEAYGKVLVLQMADGLTMAFAHLGEFSVAQGDTLTAGQKIAEIGVTGLSTGPHVHIETFVDGELVDPASVWTQLAR